MIFWLYFYILIEKVKSVVNIYKLLFWLLKTKITIHINVLYFLETLFRPYFATTICPSCPDVCVSPNRGEARDGRSIPDMLMYFLPDVNSIYEEKLLYCSVQASWVLQGDEPHLLQPVQPVQGLLSASSCPANFDLTFLVLPASVSVKAADWLWNPRKTKTDWSLLEVGKMDKEDFRLSNLSCLRKVAYLMPSKQRLIKHHDGHLNLACSRIRRVCGRELITATLPPVTAAPIMAHRHKVKVLTALSICVMEENKNCLCICQPPLLGNRLKMNRLQQRLAFE